MKLFSSIVAGVAMFFAQKNDYDHLPARKGQMHRGRGAMLNQRQKRIRRRRANR